MEPFLRKKNELTSGLLLETRKVWLLLQCLTKLVFHVQSYSGESSLLLFGKKNYKDNFGGRLKVHYEFSKTREGISLLV